MRLSNIAVCLLTAISGADAANHQVNCYPNSPTTNHQFEETLLNSDLRGKADSDLRYGFWNGRWQTCCTDNEMKSGCRDTFTFTYNHPYNWASKRSRVQNGGQTIDFTCYDMGWPIKCEPKRT
ncbi:hypothetical protein FOMA001_g17308 [Fusarium oxysporum f. sp. matthiolae]|nr:hypothetical protein FOMA001_g18582 [Fusarium oxysporum f. sp. matthiolae]KAH7465202.1 hypothetical protein FOMA001_g17308 [Fusarium oxysporum f. sp. matthiolae]